VKIALGCDHAGFDYKEKIKVLLPSLGHEFHDFGTFSKEPAVDYPLFIRPESEGVARGEAIVANKVKGIRCALCWSLETARLAREHNDSNVLSIGERMIPSELAMEIVKIWLETPFAGGRHARRVDMIEHPENFSALPS
jgi:ribose 5-phosphate isomerase B